MKKSVHRHEKVSPDGMIADNRFVQKRSLDYAKSNIWRRTEPG